MHCGTCEHGFSPATKALGLGDSEFTPRLEEVVTMVATTVSYGTATKVVASCSGVEVSIKGIEQMIERRASQLERLDKEQSDRCMPYDPMGLPVDSQVLPSETVAEKETPKVAYMEIDGVFAMTREEITGKQLSANDKRRQTRAKKQKARGGKGRRYEITGREVKNAVLYSADACAKQSPERGCILKKTYVSHLGDWFTFAMLLWVAVLRLRFHKAKQQFKEPRSHGARTESIGRRIWIPR